MKSLLQTYNDISLRTNNDSQSLELCNIECSGTDYYCTLYVKSKGFSAASRFQFNEEFLLPFLENLDRMETSLHGKATLKNYFDENYITLELSPTGQVEVSGTLTAYDEFVQRLEFCFQTDQTVLKPLLDDFGKYMKFG